MSEKARNNDTLESDSLLEKKHIVASGVTLTMFTIRRPQAEIFGAPTKYKIFTVS